MTKIFEVGESDIKAIDLMEKTTKTLRESGRQVLMVVDNFATPAGYGGNITSVEIDRKGNGVLSMLVDLINNIYEPRGIYFSTAYEFLGREARARGLLK